jgi:hypothetical protein
MCSGAILMWRALPRFIGDVGFFGCVRHCCLLCFIYLASVRFCSMPFSEFPFSVLRLASLEQIPTIDEPELFVLVDGRVLGFCDFVKDQATKSMIVHHYAVRASAGMEDNIRVLRRSLRE